ncbi:MAG TPA: hypothetical protein PLX59_00780 [Candidatus Cloacimonadota bacterium]|nr:hypothetical protein [Candidatus Cloacimonadota bacterium]
MQNTTRNSIILAVLLIMVLALGITVTRRFNSGSEEYIRKNQSAEANLKQLDYQLSKIDSLRTQYGIQQLVTQQSKLILGADSPTITYQYLLKLLRWMDRQMIFDFALSEGGAEQANWHEYVISGRGLYKDLLHLTANLEHQKTIITIEELAIGSDTVAASDTVSYSLIIRTHFKEGGMEPDTIEKGDIPRVYDSFTAFKTRIYDTPPPQEHDPRLLNIDNAQLIGISANKIFIRDENRVIRILSLNDRIAGGYLYSIDPNQGKVTFKVDTFGVWENRTLFINQPN